MSLLVPNSSESTMLRYILNKAAPEDLDIRLYTNDKTPNESDTVVDYVEVSGNGYSEIQLGSGNWIITEGNPTSAAHPQVTWSFTGIVGNVYGYFVTRRVSGDLMWSERFSNGPYNIQRIGDQIRITPKLSLE